MNSQNDSLTLQQQAQSVKFKDIAMPLGMLGISFSLIIGISQIINNAKYVPSTPSGRIVTEQDSNGLKVVVILDQIEKLKEQGVLNDDIFNCVIRDGYITVSDLSTQGNELGMYVVESKKDWLDHSYIIDKTLGGDLNKEEYGDQGLYDKGLNTLFSVEISKKCLK